MTTAIMFAVFMAGKLLAVVTIIVVAAIGGAP